MAAKDKNLNDFFLDTLKDIYDAEKQILKALPKMAKAAQVEHYEISRYGTLKQWAQQLGMKEAVRLLDETLQQEKKADESLTSLAEAAVNLAAAA